MASSYEDFKYMIQDTGRIYVGAKYTYRELMENPECNFKFKSIMEHYLFKESDPDTTLESEFYYMDDKSFVFRTYQQLKIKCKINIIEEQKKLFRENTFAYKERIISLEELVKMPLTEKKKRGVVIQEIILSKLALISFVV